MTKADLIEEVSRAVAIPRKDSELIVDAILDTIGRALRRADKVEVGGFGRFRMRPRRSRVGRNPKTCASVEVPAKKMLTSRPPGS
jgi:integration host factor subunit beta